MFAFSYIRKGNKVAETINAATFADAKAQVMNIYDLSAMDEATLTDERGRVKVLRRPSLNSPLNRYRVEINVIMPKDNGDTYDDLHTFTATSVEACRKLAASTAADFNAPARVAIYDGRVEIERYNIPSRWVIQDRETGTEIDYFDSYEEACAGLNRYEQDDMDNGVYTPDFYEIREK